MVLAVALASYIRCIESLPTADNFVIESCKKAAKLNVHTRVGLITLIIPIISRNFKPN